MTAALEGGEWSAARPSNTLPLGMTRYPFYRRLGGPQDWSERTENLVPTGTQFWTIQLQSQSLYWLSYPTHNVTYLLLTFQKLKYPLNGFLHTTNTDVYMLYNSTHSNATAVHKISLSLLHVHMAKRRPQPCRGLLTVPDSCLWMQYSIIPPCFPHGIILILALKSLMNTSHFTALFHQNIWYTSLLRTLPNV